MARLDFFDNVTCHLKAESLANLPATPASTDLWNDSSGFDRDFILQGAGITILHNEINGYPAVDFDGISAYAVNNGSLSDFIAAGAGSVFTVFRANSIGTNAASPPLNDGVWAADVATGAGVYLRSVPEVVAFNRSGAQNFERAIAIQTGVWYVHMWRHKGGRLAAALDDALTFIDIASGNTDTLNVDVFLGKNHEASAKFADIAIAEIIFANLGHPDQDCATIVNYLAAKFGSRGDAHGQAVNVGSRTLWELREPRLLVTVPALPPAAMDVDAGDVIGVSHSEIPDPAGQGAGVKNWERLPLAIREARPNLDLQTVKLVGERVRQHTFYLAAQAAATPGQGLVVSAVSPGPVLFRRMVPGTQAVAADGLAWTVRAADNIVAALRDGLLKIEPRGLLSENGARQDVLRSAFATGSPPTGWTLVQPTGGSVAAELVSAAGIQLWDSGITGQCLKFTRGTSGDGDASHQGVSPQNNVDGSQFGVVQIDAAGVDSGAVWLLREDPAGDYWNDSTEAWQAGVAENDLAVSSGISQTVSKPIPFIDNVSVTLTIRQKTSVGSPGDVLRVFYAGRLQEVLTTPAQKPRVRWPLSRIFSDQPSSAVFTGQDHGPIFPNHSGARNWNNARGALLARFSLRFNTSDVVNVDATALKFVIAHVYHDANNEILIHYYRDSAGAVAEFRFDVKAAGTTYRATFPYTVVRDAEINFWCRWTSASDGELNKPARTLTIGVNGVTGSDAQASAYPMEASQSWLGITASAQPAAPSPYLLPLNGWLPSLELLAECPPDEVLHAWRY